MTESERAELIAKITANPHERDALAKKFAAIDKLVSEIGAKLVEADRRLNVLEKQNSAEAVKPSHPGLGSWSPENLAAVIAGMNPAELEKLRQS